MSGIVNFKASTTSTLFMRCNARFRVLCGPFRSGKSVTSIVEIVRRAKEQKPGKDGIRRSRWAVIRNTMPQLRDTTMKTWFDWFPDGSCGWWKETGKTFYLEFGDVRAEVMFRALDDANDVKNLLSLELTGAYINEAREIPREIVEGLDGRINQYPKMSDGGATWAGIWADTNPPEENSYWWSMLEGLDPDTGDARKNDWVIFRQPGGMMRVGAADQCDYIMRNGWRIASNPKADNIENLPAGYYTTLVRDKSDEYVKVYVLGMYGQGKSGKPVHPLFDPDYHVARDILRPNPKLLLVIGADFGGTPAMTIKQQDPHGRVLTYDEIVTEKTEGFGLQRAINERLKPLLRNKYAGYNVRVTGDPSGNTGAQTDEKTCADIFKQAGFRNVKFAYSNNPIHRQGATTHFLSKRTELGAAYLVSPNCSYLIRGMKGGYHWKISKGGVTSPEVDKNIFSHICEGGEYADMYFFKGDIEPERDESRKEWLRQLNNRKGMYTRRT